MTLDEYTMDSKKRGALILALRRAIVTEFNGEDWREFGYLSGESDYIQRHDRLLRSLHWQDPDYGDCVLQALERFSREGWDVVDQLINHPKLTSHLLKEIPNLSIFVRRDLQSVKTEAPASLSSGDVVLLALNDAEHLMHITGPVSAVDRLHTALHGYFRSLRVEGGIAVADDASLTALFKALRTALRYSRTWARTTITWYACCMGLRTRSTPSTPCATTAALRTRPRICWANLKRTWPSMRPGRYSTISGPR